MLISDAEICAARILIVDDQESNVALLSELLKEGGYVNVASTMRPQEVRDLHRLNRYDLILLDLQMPGMDGFDVLRGLRADATHDYVPVLVVTAQPAHKLRALQAGAKDFVSKPFDIVELRTRTRNLLEVRLLYRRLERYNAELEHRVAERTAELHDSEARFRSLVELASDWYWEQAEDGTFTRTSGPVFEMLGLTADATPDDSTGDAADGWNEGERAALQQKIAAREPFLDVLLSRRTPAGACRSFRISGEPMFNRSAHFVGYRGVGVELPASLDGS
jgi:CheY-like chemotaxis protein